MNNKYLISIGVLDLASFAYSAYSYGVNGLFGRISDEFAAAREFGLGMQFVYVVGLLLLLSFLISGAFMIMERRLGVIVSLLQVPFRLIMVVPPSLYLLMAAFGDSISVVLAIIVFEVVKTIYLIRWVMRPPIAF